MGNFEYKTEIKVPAKGDGEDAVPEHIAPITLVFKRYGDAPGRISRRNIGNIERQVWSYLEWGLIEPRHWPDGSEVPGHMIFDELPQRVVTKIYRAWQESEDTYNEDSDDKE